MDTKLFIFRPAEDVRIEMLDLPEDPGFSRLDRLLRPLLDGAGLEHVRVLFRGRCADMFVDKLSATKGLPINDAATAIYRAATLRREPERSPESLPAVFGPAVVFDRIVWR